MRIASNLDHLHARARHNRWMKYFAWFCRLGLAWGFLPSGFTKIVGERFTVLTVMHPMGHFLDAFFRTGYYYTVVGYCQVLAAVLLLIPRTATLGAVIYFPIILNIAILSLAVRFEGSLVSSPLMVLANLYLLCWDYHKLKYILPIYSTKQPEIMPCLPLAGNRFPVWFFGGVAAAVLVVVLAITQGYSLMPRNIRKDCLEQCPDSQNPEACATFCDCIHKRGEALNKCLEEYKRASQ